MRSLLDDLALLNLPFVVVNKHRACHFLDRESIDAERVDEFALDRLPPWL